MEHFRQLNNLQELKELHQAIGSIKNAISNVPASHFEDSELAWVYVIMMDYDDEGIEELREKHDWSDWGIEQLKKHRDSIQNFLK